MIKKIEKIEAIRIEVQDNFFVLVTPEKANGSDIMEFRLMRENYSGVIDMFGIEEQDLNKIAEIVEQNVEEYINLWNEEYGEADVSQEEK